MCDVIKSAVKLNMNMYSRTIPSHMLCLPHPPVGPLNSRDLITCAVICRKFLQRNKILSETSGLLLVGCFYIILIRMGSLFLS